MVRKTKIVMNYKHIYNVKVTPIFSDDKKFRYSLEIIKTDALKSNIKTVCVIMQNPSYADKGVADKSVQFIEKLIFCKGYKEFDNVYKIIVVNQYAYIQTLDFEGEKIKIGINTDSHIKSAIDNSEIILIAWGSSNKYIDRQKTINSMINLANNKVSYKTKSHPSRGSYKNFISAYTP
jgi:hypothetical protein